VAREPEVWNLTIFATQTPVGCKIIILTSSLPSLGPGALKNREDPKLLGASKVRRLIEIGEFESP
jgi:protein transport protein SEC24